MPLTRIRDWNDREIQAVQSRGGVWAFPDFADGLLKPAGTFPPAEVVQKLFRSDRLMYFYPEDQPLLASKLGYYCDLQSAHSEDAIVWSYFGPLARACVSLRAAWATWLLARCGFAGTAQDCDIVLWRRVPHPDNQTPGGPEIDVTVCTDVAVILIEAKWRSAESRWQGIDGQTGQMDLRRRFLDGLGSRVFGRPAMLTSVLLDAAIASSLPSLPVLTWADLVSSTFHPSAEEVRRYYDWKRHLIPRKHGAVAPG